jgi:hypothetical protein
MAPGVSSGVGWVDVIKMDVREIGWDGIGLIWLRIGTSGGLL